VQPRPAAAAESARVGMVTGPSDLDPQSRTVSLAITRNARQSLSAIGQRCRP